MAINYAPNYGNTFPNNQNLMGFQNPMPYGNQQMQQDDNSIMAVFVQGEAGATNYLVRSGTTVMPIDFQAGKFWLKSNTGGIPQRMRHFVFKEVFPEQEQPNQPTQTGSAVTREEFASLSKSVSALTDNVNKLIADLGGGLNE